MRHPLTDDLFFVFAGSTSPNKTAGTNALEKQRRWHKQLKEKSKRYNELDKPDSFKKIEVFWVPLENNTFSHKVVS